MKRFVATLLTLHPDLNNNKFDGAVIDAFVKEQPSIPVRLNFQGKDIGRTTKFLTSGSDKDEDQKLIVEFELNYDFLDALRLYAVPGGTCDIRDIETGKDGISVIKKFTPTSISLTTTPVDTHITQIIVKDDDAK